MLASIVRQFRLYFGLLLVALLLQGLVVPAGADELSDFHAAVEQASAQYRVALLTLETSSQEDTAAEVHRLRDAWHGVIDRFGANRPAPFVDDEAYTTLLVDMDVRIIGVLLVIDMGRREAARDALVPIGETLSQLSARSAAPLR